MVKYFSIVIISLLIHRVNLFEKNGNWGAVHTLSEVREKTVKHLCKISRNFLDNNIFSIEKRRGKERGEGKDGRRYGERENVNRSLTGY